MKLIRSTFFYVFFVLLFSPINSEDILTVEALTTVVDSSGVGIFGENEYWGMLLKSPIRPLIFRGSQIMIVSFLIYF